MIFIKKFLIFILTLSICIFCFYVPAYADVIYLDHETYGFDVSLTERAQSTSGGVSHQGFIITADDDDTLYYIGCKDASGYIQTSFSQGVYNGHSYGCYTATTNYQKFNVQSAPSGSTEYGPGSNYTHVIVGDDYIRQHISALATDELNLSSSYIYGGSVMIADGGLVNSQLVKNFFPRTPVTVLTKAIQPATVQGVLLEIVELLPVLIPLIVSLLALRKGLRFTYQILRAA